eukprot:298438-Rhodomonas_salina.1
MSRCSPQVCSAAKAAPCCSCSSEPGRKSSLTDALSLESWSMSGVSIALACAARTATMPTSSHTTSASLTAAANTSRCGVAEYVSLPSCCRSFELVYHRSRDVCAFSLNACTCSVISGTSPTRWESCSTRLAAAWKLAAGRVQRAVPNPK